MPLTESSIPGLVPMPPRAKTGSDTPAVNALISTYGTIPASGADGYVLTLLASDPKQIVWQQHTFVPPPLVTALPGSPQDADEIYFDTQQGGVIWHLRYSTSDNKWHFLGGPPLVNEVATRESVAPGGGAPWVDFPTVGPQITLPVAGDYDVEVSAGAMAISGTTGVNWWMSYTIGATAPVNTDGVQAVVATTNEGWTGRRTQRKTGLGAVALVAKYTTDSGLATITAGRRTMIVSPVRLG